MNDQGYPAHLAFPFRIGPGGRMARTQSIEEHVSQELIQLILTNPGERAYLPDFGGGARRLIFEEISDVTAGLTKARITQAITRWLGQRITLQDLEVKVKDETIEVEIKYRIAGTDDTRVMRFQRGGDL